MKTHKIAVLSDTHGLLRPEVIECAQSCEGILHAGDFDNQKVFGALQQIAPLYAVRGTMTAAGRQSSEKTLKSRCLDCVFTWCTTENI